MTKQGEMNTRSDELQTCIIECEVCGEDTLTNIIGKTVCNDCREE